MKNLIATVLGILIALLLGPVLCYVCGWIGGWVLLRMFGGSLGIAVINGLNTLSGTTRFAPEVLPTICGTLGVLSSFFAVSASKSNK